VDLQPKWYKLKSTRKGNKKNLVSGEIQMQFSLIDTYNTTATEEETLRRYKSVIAAGYEDDDEILSRTPTTQKTIMKHRTKQTNRPGKQPRRKRKSEKLVSDANL
jgi:phosphatidylserine decarboxylase